jgi:hypothetical protein
MAEALKRLNLKFPTADGKALAEMKRIRRALLAEKPG